MSCQVSPKVCCIHYTAPHTSAQNGKAEQCHRMIMNRACVIRSDANLPPSLWGEFVHAVGYLKKITTTRTLKDKTPYEAWYSRCPDVSHLRELGCHVWVLVMDKNPKIYNCSIECKLTIRKPTAVGTVRLAIYMSHEMLSLPNHSTFVNDLSIQDWF